MDCPLADTHTRARAKTGRTTHLPQTLAFFLRARVPPHQTPHRDVVDVKIVQLMVAITIITTTTTTNTNTTIVIEHATITAAAQIIVEVSWKEVVVPASHGARTDR